MFMRNSLPDSDGHPAKATGKAMLDALFTERYQRIKDLAARLKSRRSDLTMSRTTLAHQAYLKLVRDPPDFASMSYDEVIAILANAMRQILVDAGRQKYSRKRDPKSLFHAPPAQVEDALTDWLAIEPLLQELERENPRQRQIIDCRFYLGMTVDETAAALSVSAATIEREWRQANVRLRCMLNLEKP